MNLSRKWLNEFVTVTASQLICRGNDLVRFQSGGAAESGTEALQCGCRSDPFYGASP